MMPSRPGSGPQTLDPQTQAVGAWLPGRQPDGESGPFGRANRASPRRAGGLRAGRRPSWPEWPHAASSAEKTPFPGEPAPPASPRGSGGVQPGL